MEGGNLCFWVKKFRHVKIDKTSPKERNQALLRAEIHQFQGFYFILFSISCPTAAKQSNRETGTNSDLSHHTLTYTV